MHSLLSIVALCNNMFFNCVSVKIISNNTLCIGHYVSFLYNSKFENRETRIAVQLSVSSVPCSRVLITVMTRGCIQFKILDKSLHTKNNSVRRLYLSACTEYILLYIYNALNNLFYLMPFMIG